MKASFAGGLLVVLLPLAATLSAAEKPNRGERPDREEMKAKLLERFDADGDGQLNQEERAAAQRFMEKRRMGQGRGNGGNQAGGQGRGQFGQQGNQGQRGQFGQQGGRGRPQFGQQQGNQRGQFGQQGGRGRPQFGQQRGQGQGRGPAQRMGQQGKRGGQNRGKGPGGRKGR